MAHVSRAFVRSLRERYDDAPGRRCWISYESRISTNDNFINVCSANSSNYYDNNITNKDDTRIGHGAIELLLSIICVATTTFTKPFDNNTLIVIGGYDKTTASRKTIDCSSVLLVGTRRNALTDVTTRNNVCLKIVHGPFFVQNQYSPPPPARARASRRSPVAVVLFVKYAPTRRSTNAAAVVSTNQLFCVSGCQ